MTEQDPFNKMNEESKPTRLIDFPLEGTEVNYEADGNDEDSDIEDEDDVCEECGELEDDCICDEEEDDDDDEEEETTVVN